MYWIITQIEKSMKIYGIFSSYGPLWIHIFFFFKFLGSLTDFPKNLTMKKKKKKETSKSYIIEIYIGLESIARTRENFFSIFYEEKIIKKKLFQWITTIVKRQKDKRSFPLMVDFKEAILCLGRETPPARTCWSVQRSLSASAEF